MEQVFEQFDTLIKLEETAEYIAENWNLSGSYGLFTGKCGIALFLLYYSKLTGKERFFDIGGELIHESFKDLKREKRVAPFLANGLCGLASCIDLLYDMEITSEHSQDVFGENIYDRLNIHAEKALKQRNYDYLHGAVGILIYLIEKNYDISRSLATLFDLGREDSTYIKWPSVIPHAENADCYNLAAAHGNANILFLLLRTYEKNRAPSYEEKIKKLINFFLTYKKNGPDNCCFPGSQLGWCSGDLGIAYILLDASEVIPDAGLKAFAISTLRSCAIITDKGNFLSDACFCHGSAGVAHIFNKLYQRTGDPDFKLASVYWHDITLKLAVHKDGAAGYKSRRGDYYIRSLSFLDGIAGIGLSLMASIPGTTSQWDKFFML